MTTALPGRLLLVDDEASILFAMTRYFHAKGLSVDAAPNLESALQLAAEQQYRVAIVDLRLSAEADNEGMLVVEALCRHQADCSVIVLTAFGSDEVRERARDLGVAAFLKKPRRLPELLSIVLDQLHTKSSHARPSA